jgi:molecular chaperone GrpE
MDEKDQPPDEPSPEEDRPETPEAVNVALLQEQLEEALREKDQFRTMAQRAQADLMNLRRRAAEELGEQRRSANSGLLLKILSLADDLGRALSLVPEDAVAPGWLDGVRLVQRNISNILESEGVSKIEAVGRPFEPWEFEAVQYAETSDADEGQVIQVLREGYKHGDKVLRAAQVVVAKKPETKAAASDTIEEEPE